MLLCAHTNRCMEVSQNLTSQNLLRMLRKRQWETVAINWIQWCFLMRQIQQMLLVWSRRSCVTTGYTGSPSPEISSSLLPATHTGSELYNKWDHVNTHACKKWVACTLDHARSKQTRPDSLPGIAYNNGITYVECNCVHVHFACCIYTLTMQTFWRDDRKTWIYRTRVLCEGNWDAAKNR